MEQSYYSMYIHNHYGKVIPAANSFENSDAAGWVYKLINEGFMRKRWRKRYCVLSNGVLYLYEQQKSDGTEKTCSTVNLKHYAECVKAPRKQCKKSPNTVIIEPIKKEDKTESTKNSKQINREFFYTETPEDQEKWLAKLKESLSMANIGGGSKLKHITKTRARPPRGGGGNRRPPTKQHLKERAMMSEVSLDSQEAETANSESIKKRGNIPVLALRPPPGSGKVPLKSPTLSQTEVTGTNEEIENVPNNDDMTATPTVSSPISPKPPPAALKPKLSKFIVRNGSVGSSGSHESLPPLLESAPMVDDETTIDDSEKLSSSPSSKTSSLDRMDKASVNSLSNSDCPPSPPPPLLDNSTNVDENHNDEEATEESVVRSEKLETLKEKFNLKLKKNERILKARSMMDLDRDSDNEEPLPPPPSPPPSPPAETESNGDFPIEETKKCKKRKGSVKARPSSLVIDV
uniref:pleckstrin homology domain-containing family O member 1-like isoform X1 n=1 Tax=Styela clava TaxID=7725 RepID=UPI00193ACE28|nr:pleckstrin homology domain-containing family O member 1-like isoform X1 [Styela clava]